MEKKYRPKRVQSGLRLDVEIMRALKIMADAHGLTYQEAAEQAIADAYEATRKVHKGQRLVRG